MLGKGLLEALILNLSSLHSRWAQMPAFPMEQGHEKESTIEGEVKAMLARFGLLTPAACLTEDLHIKSWLEGRPYTSR